MLAHAFIPDRTDRNPLGPGIQNRLQLGRPLPTKPVTHSKCIFRDLFHSSKSFGFIVLLFMSISASVSESFHVCFF
jgi:hypothetical protein